MLHKSRRVSQAIQRVTYRCYDTMNPSEYVANYTSALLTRDWQRKKLKPMIEASE